MASSVETRVRPRRRPGARSQSLRQRVDALLAEADVKIGGARPWDIQVHDEQLYARVLAEAALGLGESYMDGWWDCERLDEFFHRILAAELETKV